MIADAGLDLAVSVVAVTRAADDRADAHLHRRLARSHLPHLLLNLDRMLHVVLPEAAVERPSRLQAGRADVRRRQ